MLFRSSLSMGLSGQVYWSGLPCPAPGDLPNPGIKPTFPVSPALADRFFPTEPLRKFKSLKIDSNYLLEMVLS